MQTERLLHLIYKITATQGKKHAYQVRHKVVAGRLCSTLVGEQAPLAG